MEIELDFYYPDFPIPDDEDDEEYFDYSFKRQLCAQNGIFYGHDYNELFLAWGLNLTAYNMSEKGIERLAKDYFNLYIWQYHYLSSRLTKKVAKDIRKYCLAMIDEEAQYEGSEYSKVWKAMAEIKDNYILFQFFWNLISLMWT